MKASRFLSEIPSSLISDENKGSMISASGFSQKSRDDTKKAVSFDYKIGDFLEHNMWGKGQVLNVKKLKGDMELDVNFYSVGLKHLLVSFAPIKKIEK
jgi:DNA helicase-2/ATP-dependent DNA helicase PcrA